MLKNLKKEISNKIHENFNSHLVNFINRKVNYSYKQILNFEDNCSFKYKKLLIDGSFYNLGYFYRLQIFRTAIKNENLEEFGYTWNFNKTICRNTLNTLGIKNIIDMSKYKNKSFVGEAENIIKNIKDSRDIIDYKFPEDVPGLYLYDIILKKQRNKTVDINDKNLKFYVFEFLSSIDSSKNLIEKIKPDVLALSHCISFQCAPLAHIALKNGIDTFILSGNFGGPRFLRLSKTKDMFYGISHPNKEDFRSIDASKIKKFRKIGYEYLEKRKLGEFTDLSGRFAFGKGKEKFNLSDSKYKKKKIIAVYVGNWFDFPHMFGMQRFLDVYEWIIVTIKFAAKNKNVIWLIKPHPLEKWYGGITLENSLSKNLPKNIVILPNNYDGKAIMKISDALVTFHGTSGIEYAAAGKPVLVADVGWYHDCDFVVFPKSREHFLNLLNTKWYEKVDKKEIKYNAELFAGLRFAVPFWQKDALIPDDPDRKILREFLPEFINKKKIMIKKEINVTREWIKSRKIDYHTFKVIKSDRNIIQGAYKKL